MGQFYAGSIKKLSQVLEIVRQQYVNGDGRHSEHLSLLKKMFALMVFALS